MSHDRLEDLTIIDDDVGIAVGARRDEVDRTISEIRILE